MGILVQFWQDMQRWETPVKVSFWMATGLQVVLLILLAIGRDRVPSWALIGVVVLGIMMQGLAFYGNRHLVTPYTLAQRAFMAGEFLKAQGILEAYISDQSRAGKNVSADAYVLLGNTLRNLGDVNASERILRRIVQQQPDYAFALYGLGRTLLTQGKWAESAEIIKKSLLLGAPSGVSFDLGYATLEAGDTDSGRRILAEALPQMQEPYRRIMTLYLLDQLSSTAWDSETADATAYWEREASVFHQTAYGVRVSQQLAGLRAELAKG